MNIESIIYDRQKKFGYIKSMNFHREIYGKDVSRFNLELELISYPNNDENVFTIIFEGICDVNIPEIDKLSRLFIHIEDVSANQCEDINYAVWETEGELFKFSCKEIKIKDIL